MLEERKSQSVSSCTKNNVGRQSSQKRKVNLKEAPRLFGGGGSFFKIFYVKSDCGHDS